MVWFQDYVYEVGAYNSWEVWSNFQLCHTFEGMGLQIVVTVINCGYAV